MLRSRFDAWVCAAVLAMFAMGNALAQTYPSKTIRILTGPAASGSDIVARLIAQEMAAPIGQPIIVENRAGILAVEAAAKAPPDAYTLLVYGSVVWMEPLLRANVAWDPVKDLTPITLAARSPNVLVVTPSLPVLKSLSLTAGRASTCTISRCKRPMSAAGVLAGANAPMINSDS